MKLETLIGLVILALVGLLSLASPEAVNLLGLFAIGWTIPDASRFLVGLFRKRNIKEA